MKNETLQVIFQRKSVRAFTNTEIDEEAIDLLAEAVRKPNPPHVAWGLLLRKLSESRDWDRFEEYFRDVPEQARTADYWIAFLTPCALQYLDRSDFADKLFTLLQTHRRKGKSVIFKNFGKNPPQPEHQQVAVVGLFFGADDHLRTLDHLLNQHSVKPINF